MRTPVAQEQSAGYYGKDSRSVNGLRRQVRHVGNQNGQRYFDGAVVEVFVDSLHDYADNQPERQSRHRQIKQPQEPCAHRRRLPVYHHGDPKFQRQQSCSIIHQALTLENVYDSLRQSDTLGNRSRGDSVRGCYNRPKDEYKSGGNTIRKITSGSSEILGIPGTKLNSKPSITRTMGYGVWSFRASAAKTTTNTSNRRRTSSIA